ncbi:MAG: GntR family transcriptional regulator [Oscillospiraceae bacterium]|nr:GntR family transcriptional regulator [Oscillospiraceae bacterium]MBQ6901909.1 GntR family transcriptional regulator [Oscillospiraceae bacterium]
MEKRMLKTVSTVDAICSQLENDIFFNLSPGEKITESSLNLRYGVSRNTLREAIAYLISNGILVKIANRGVFVREITREDVREIFSLRALLEAEAIRMIIEKNVSTSALSEKAELLTNTNPHDDWNEHVRADMDFHSTLVASAKSPRLSRLYDAIASEVMLCICQSKQHIPLTTVNDISHRAILNALSEKKQALACQLLKKHIESAISNYEKGFDAQI